LEVSEKFLIFRKVAIMSKKLVFPLAFLSITASSLTFAGQCDISLEATASMAFSSKEITISKACKEVNLTLKNTGTMPKAAMGHNLVISKKSDMQGILADGNTAGLSKNFVKENDPRVIAYTPVLGGGESSTIKFKTDKFDTKEAFSFFCSFPGHAAVMNGVVKVN
jgi:azurin